MKLVDYNMGQDGDTEVTATSSQPNFPVTNIKNEFRAKDWRSSGFFNLSLTPTGEQRYSQMFVAWGDSPEISYIDLELNGQFTQKTLCAEIKSQLDDLDLYTLVDPAHAALDLDFDVYFNKEGKITIALLDHPTFTITAGNSFATFLGLDVDEANPMVAEKACIHQYEAVMFDLKTTEEVDTIALMWKKGGYQLTSDAQIFIEGNATSNFASPGFSEQVYFDDKNEVIELHFSTPKNYRYWRIKIIDKENSYLYVNIGTVVIGLANQSITCTSNGFGFALKDGSKVLSTDFGQSYTDKYPKLKVLNINFDTMTMDETDSIIEMFDNVGLSQTIYISLDPTEAIFTNGQFWIYGKLSESLSVKHQSGTLFNSGLKIEESN